MPVIREYAAQHFIVVIREDNYTSDLNKFIRLFEIAQEDFPSVRREDTTIVQYGGILYKRTFGIEFKAEDAPDTYLRINDTELKL